MDSNEKSDFKIQTTNHRIVQVLLDEGHNLGCNGGISNTVRLLATELNITNQEACQILLGCDFCTRGLRHSLQILANVFKG